MRRTWAPTAVALGVRVTVALVIGWSKSTCSHCPTAACSALDTQLVDVSPSIAAAGPDGGGNIGQRSRIRCGTRGRDAAAGPLRRRPGRHPGAG